ncbi:hypothetical protein [Sphingomonas sp. PP-CE-1G-424]|uniref:hypothetical protein n=1 Tax=Sphingomonas sp. PP-CE-1G-424 TaxID=2135658 RepID=UPI001055EE27|nr:hypothetical protein [Sphingomonas sp. PP-CE-1G-424]TCP65896.1 hypothetical protein C8J43_108100 [Sphingomonas sp. PP-CE-1G-424]
MTDNQSTPPDSEGATDEIGYVKFSSGDLLFMLTRLAVITGNVITAVSVMAGGDTTNAARLASEAGAKLDGMLEEIANKLREALADHDS